MNRSIHPLTVAVIAAALVLGGSVAAFADDMEVTPSAPHNTSDLHETETSPSILTPDSDDLSDSPSEPASTPTESPSPEAESPDDLPRPTVLTCPPGRVPGWLDENGNPTSCVDDNPCIFPTVLVGDVCVILDGPDMTPPVVSVPPVIAVPPTTGTPAADKPAPDVPTQGVIDPTPASLDEVAHPVHEVVDNVRTTLPNTGLTLVQIRLYWAGVIMLTLGTLAAATGGVLSRRRQ